jgi:hypothetical protein
MFSIVIDFPIHHPLQIRIIRLRSPGILLKEDQMHDKSSVGFDTTISSCSKGVDE